MLTSTVFCILDNSPVPWDPSRPIKNIVENFVAANWTYQSIPSASSVKWSDHGSLTTTLETSAINGNLSPVQPSSAQNLM